MPSFLRSTVHARSLTVRSALAAAVALFALLAGACDEDTSTSDEESTGSEQTTTSAAEGGDVEADEVKTGEGEITVGGSTFEFTSDDCLVGAGNEAVVSVNGTGTADGRQFEVIIARTQPAENFVERVTFAYSGTEASVFTRIAPAAEATFEIDDQTASANGLTFTGSGGAPSGEGGFTVTCDG